METKTKTSGSMKIMGGVINMPTGSANARDHFVYQFTLLRGAKAGSTFAIVGSRAGDGYQLDTTIDAGGVQVTANGANVSWNIGSGSNKSTADYVPVAQTHKIVSVSGENGLTIELPAILSAKLPKVPIKRISE